MIANNPHYLIVIFTCSLVAFCSVPRLDAKAQEPAKGITPLPKKQKSVSSQAGFTSKYFHMDLPDFGILGSFSLDEEEINNRGKVQESRVSELREGFELATQGWAYLPEFFQYTLNITPSWSQIDESGDGPIGDESSFFLHDYQLDGTLLPEKPYSLHLFGKRTEDNLVSTFTNQSTVLTESYGADLSLKYPSFPSFFRYQHLERDQEGFFLTEDSRDDYRIDMFHYGGNVDTRLFAQFIDSTQQSGDSTSDVQTSINRLTNTIRFANDQRRRLTSTLTYNLNRDDDFETSTLRLHEQLNFAHRRNLWSTTILQVSRIEQEEFKEEGGLAKTELNHLLYENLTSSLSFEAERLNFNDGDESRYQPALQFDYKRPIPWGEINLTSGWDFNFTERSGEIGEIAVNGEVHTLSATTPAILNQEFIDRDSIRVTDEMGTTIFLLNQDYTLEEIGNLVRIRRTLLGNINNGQTIRVSYRFLGDSGFDDSIFTQNYGISTLLFTKLRLSYNYFHASQDILSGSGPTNKIDDTIQRATVQLFYRWWETRLSYDDFSTSTSPSRTNWRAEQSVRLHPHETVALNFSLYYGETRFSDLFADDEFYGLTSSFIWTPALWLRAGAEGWYDRLEGDAENSAVTNLLSYIEVDYGKWHCNMSYRFRETDDDVRDFQRTEHNFLVKFTREL